MDSYLLLSHLLIFVAEHQINSFCHHTADENDDKSYEKIADRQITQRQIQLLNACGDPHVYEQLAGVGVRKESQHRVTEADSRVKKRNLILFFHESAKRICHRVADTDHCDDRQK